MSDVDTVETAADVLVTDASDADQTDAVNGEAQDTDEETAAHEATLAEFVRLADAAAESADPETGTVVEAELDPVKRAYRAITGGAKFKNKAKNHIQDSMKASLSAGVKGVPQAVAWNTIQEAVAAPLPKQEKQSRAAAPVSPNKAFADKATSFRLAVDLIENDLPEGVTDDWETEIGENDTYEVAEAYLQWLNEDEETRGDEPEVSAVVKAAVKLATSKGPRKAGRPAGAPRSGLRRDVAAHVREVFEGLESGDFLTTSEIANRSSSIYGDETPSPGAVNNRIFPPNGKESPLLDVLTPGVNSEGTKGAFKN
jgi:hypothetical protein